LRELRFGALDIFITDEATEVMAARGPRLTDGDRPPEAILPVAPEGVSDAPVIPSPVRALMRRVSEERRAGGGPDTGTVIRDVQLPDGPARVAVLRLEPAPGDDAGEPALLVTAIQDMRDDRLLLRQARTTLLLAIPLALLVSGVAGVLLAQRSLAPLEAINARAASITAANLDERLPVANPHDELGRLARIINDLLARVDTAFRTQRQFMADASHELRTPLAIIRGEAEVSLRRAGRPEAEYREALTVIQGESQRLTRIVEDLFLLARVDAQTAITAHSMASAPVALVPLVHDAIHSVRSLADARTIRLLEQLPPTEALAVHGDAMLLRRLLLNLLDNALRHAPSGSAITVALGHGPTQGTVQLRVRDEGPGVPPALRETLFNRFVHGTRIEEAAGSGTSGAGLGLAIAQAIAQAHGGGIALLEGDPGATFEITLPSYAQETAPA
jgi:signal transduction histidine kinase